MHTSGHAYEEAIIELCEITKPDVIFPIHNQNPGRFEELASEKKIGGIVKRLESKVSVDPKKLLEEGYIITFVDSPKIRNQDSGRGNTYVQRLILACRQQTHNV